MSRRWGLVLGCLLVLGTWVDPSAAKAANGIVITSTAVYDVRPDEGMAVVNVDVAATNVTPDTATEQFYYDGIALPIPTGATSVSASSGGTLLPVTLQPIDEFTQRADIAFGTGLFYQQTYRFTLSFVMTDAGGDPERETWIRSRFVALPVWGYGTDGAAGASVEVVMPRGFDVLIAYGDMDVVETDTATRAVATGIDPATFTAYVSAERGGQRTRTDVEVPMAEGTARLRFEAWPDDPDWTARQRDVLSRGLPVLEEEIGLAYPIPGTLDISEHAYQHLGQYAGFYVDGVDAIEMRFDADAFTALHEAAHVWFNQGLADERWLTEGFASYYAEVAGAAIDEDLDMFVLTDALRRSSFPLVTWGGLNVEDPAREEFAYAASHAVAREIAELAGPDVLRTVWRQAKAGDLAYGVHPDEHGTGRQPNRDDWRLFLDLFENASDADFDPIWREWLLTGALAAELSPRDEARDAYAATEARLGNWLMPASTRSVMEAWDFDTATEELASVDRLVDEHEALVERAAALSLVPDDDVGGRLGSDGIDGAFDELGNQEAALGVLEAATDRLGEERVLLEEIGLIGQADPADDLAAARGAFEEGDENDATRLAESAQAAIEDASDEGRLRVAVAGGGILLLDAIALAGLAVLARHRRPSRARRLTSGTVLDGPRLEVVRGSSLSAEGRGVIVELCSDALKTDCRDLFGFLPADAMHVLATIDGRLVGHACWATRRLSVDDGEPLRTAWIDTVVVAPDAQRNGIGSTVMRHVAELTAEYELRALGTEQMPFFARLGWESWTGPTEGVLHDPVDTLMVLRTATTPALDVTKPIAASD